MKLPLCIYHGNCADGFGAAWSVRRLTQLMRGLEVEFHAGVYQDPPPDVTDRDVIMVDFSYKRPVLLEMGSKARSIVILDHHKTAAEELAGFPEPSNIFDCWHQATYRGENGGPFIRALFDMNRSGAGLAWDYFCPGNARPRLIDYIEDRDLWRFALPNSRAINAAVFSFPYDFEVWDQMMARPLEDLALEGQAIERKHFKDIEELAGVVVREMVIGGHVVMVANVPYTLTSDMGHKLAEGRAFGACYWDTPQGRVFSLRSREDGADVSAIAKLYGGGGHRHAAGFRIAHGAGL